MAKKDKADISEDLKETNENMSAENEDVSEKNPESAEKREENSENEENNKECNFIAKEEYDALNTKVQRLQADFLNYKSRTEKERFSTYGSAVADVLTDLLPIVDNFERAISTTETDNEELINYKDGVKMIYDQFINVLQKKGLKEIDALNSKFDPNMHSGIAFEVVEDKEEDTVVEVFQKGYLVNEKVIRPSMVKIAKK